MARYQQLVTSNIKLITSNTFKHQTYNSSLKSIIPNPLIRNQYVMLETLITSKTRIKLLLKFFLNSNSSAYLRNLENEFKESTNAIRVELVRFEKAGLLKSWNKGNKKLFSANTEHPLFPAINSLIMNHIGFDRIIDTVIEKLGQVKYVFVVGDCGRVMHF